MQDIRIELTKSPKAKPTDESALGFGKIFTDHMFIMDYTTGKGWHDARIVPYGNIEFSPAAMCPRPTASSTVLTVRAWMPLRCLALPVPPISFSNRWTR